MKQNLVSGPMPITGNIADKIEERTKMAINEKRRWTIFICDEPDGELCDSGTHPNVCRHQCAAIKRFHQTHEDYSNGKIPFDKIDPGPSLKAIEVTPVDEDQI